MADPRAERPPRAPARRRFGPTVVVGLGAGVLAAVAGNRDWAVPGATDGTGSTDIARTAVAAGGTSAPLVTALGLVVLACWGVLLVTRGRFRVAVAWLCVGAAVGILAAACVGWLGAQASLTEALEGYGAVGVDTTRTAWPWLGLLAGLLATGAAAVATVDARGWPEMGSRYDAPVATGTGAPGAGGGAVAPARADQDDDATNLDLWRAMDDGHDPTQ